VYLGLGLDSPTKSVSPVIGVAMQMALGTYFKIADEFDLYLETKFYAAASNFGYGNYNYWSSFYPEAYLAGLKVDLR
jgi:hypothetical protein